MVDIPKEAEEKVNQLSAMEQSLQSFLSQKQQFQSQLLEINSALDELGNAQEAYKMVGNIMVSADKPELTKDLEHKKEMMELRIKTIEKQEKNIKEKSSKLQEEVLSQMKNG